MYQETGGENKRQRKTLSEDESVDWFVPRERMTDGNRDSYQFAYFVSPLMCFKKKLTAKAQLQNKKGQEHIFLEANDPLDGDLAGENFGKFGDVLQE